MPNLRFLMSLCVLLLLAACSQSAEPPPTIVPPARTPGIVAPPAITPTAVVTLTETPTATAQPTVARTQLSLRVLPQSVDLYESILPQLAEELPDIDVVLDIEEGNYQRGLRDGLSERGRLDLFWLPAADIAEFVEAGLVYDLRMLSMASAEYSDRDFYPGPMFHLTFNPITGTSGGPLWGLPRDVSTFALYLNLDQIEASGAADPRQLAAAGEWTWETFLEVATATAQPDNNQYGYAQYAWWGTHGVWVYGAGGRYLNDARTRCAADSLAAAQGVLFERDLYTNQLALPLDQDVATAFSEGRVAMYLSGRWSTADVRRDADFAWDVVELPSGPEGNFNWLFWGAYMVNANTKHPDASWRLLQALTDLETQNAFAAQGTNIPSRVDPNAITSFLQATPPDNNRAFLQGLSANTVAEAPLWNGDWNQFNTAIGTAIYDVLSGKIDIETYQSTVCSATAPAFEAP